jgi:hypothetical protein
MELRKTPRARESAMLKMDEIKANREIMNCLNLDLTPERAVALYLEWGSSWAHGRDFVRSEGDVSCFFKIDAWETPAKVLLVRQSISDETVLGEVEVPAEFVARALQSWGGKRGTYGLTDELRGWLKQELTGAGEEQG